MTVFNRSLLPLILTCLISFPVLSNEVNIYSARQEALIKPLLDKFSEQTAVKVNLVTGKGDALLTRLINEGENSPADILLTVDAGRLYRAQQANVLKPIEEVLNPKMIQRKSLSDLNLEIWSMHQIEDEDAPIEMAFDDEE